MTMNKEQVYDEKISPLMQGIIKVCEEHNITMMASFSIPTEESPDLACTTALLDEKGDQLHGTYKECVRLIRNPSKAMVMTIGSQGKKESNQ
ncbi:hypothetical protein L1D52_24000 [Vibrio brasiliensis]|uniref:hypothetical protein n=1 Tax=Vibrio brasiliensis TaxID=170652 RepID=UPI001EFDB8C2|nr:hypothetical protein [Vibrio brasiliensis]MCG9785375.1 hypothetical protein [Vibrio brasiliensis]